MGFWLRTSLLFVAISAGLIALFGFDWRTALDLLIVTCAILPSVVRHSPRLYLAWSRLRYTITNGETNWELVLQFTGEFTPDHVRTFAHRLALQDPGRTELLDVGSTRILIRYHRLFTVEFLVGTAVSIGYIDGPSGQDTLGVTVFEQQVSYRRSRQVLEQTLIPFIEQCRNEFAPRAASYSLRVRFDGTNPFFGLYLQQLRPDLVSEFQFEFRPPSVNPPDYVRVGKTTMTVTSGSVEGLRRSALAGLSFSSAAR